jgi:hypothetical protein
MKKRGIPAQRTGILFAAVSPHSTASPPLVRRLRPYCSEKEEISLFNHFLVKHMKKLKQLTLLVSVASLAVLTACNDNNNKGSNNSGGGNGGGNGDAMAPASMSGKLLTVQVESGTPVFQDHGSYTFLSDNGAGTSGTYHIQGFNDVPSNIGSFTYRRTGNNTAQLDEVEESGTVVQNTLTFDTATSGRISSYIPSGANPNGGVQTGTFTLEDVGGQ